VNIQIKLAIIAIAVVIPLTSIAVYGTNSNQQFTTSDSSKLQVISSFYTLHEFSQNIGQEKVDVTLLVPVGVEPHDWGPTIKDVQRMQKSDLIIINGIGFENWVDNLDEIDYQGVIVDTSNEILVKNLGQEHARTSVDPHIWLNPIYAKTQVQNIANAFSNSDPENQQYYQSNAAKYIEQLDLLDSKIRNELSNCNRDFVAFHDAFSYFADEYNLNQHTIISSNDPHGEATAKTLEDVISTARELNIKVIFSEENVNTRTSEIIANEIDGKVLVLSPLEVFSDGTYISKMTENLNNLKEALC
jgi:zinc transport system substrate-binding protein